VLHLEARVHLEKIEAGVLAGTLEQELDRAGVSVPGCPGGGDRGGRGPVEDLDPEAVRQGILVTCYGGFLVGQAAARSMIPRGKGTVLFTGASASYKGYAKSSSFAMGKFGLRGLAQSMARELAPRNIHVAHFPIDGGIRQGPDDPRAGRGEDGLLDPDAIAQTYLNVHRQHHSAWSWEIELRPWTESF
jgi:NADP-dependent 3-hydroxy acid dehydrogenase YdfG